MFKYGVLFAALCLFVASAESDVAALEKQVSSIIETIGQLKTELWKSFDEKVAYKMSQAKATKSENAIKCTVAAAQDAKEKISAYANSSLLTATENDLKQAYQFLKNGNLDSATIDTIKALVENTVVNFEKAITEYNMKFTSAGLDLAIAVIQCLKQ